MVEPHGPVLRVVRHGAIHKAALRQERLERHRLERGSRAATVERIRANGSRPARRSGRTSSSTTGASGGISGDAPAAPAAAVAPAAITPPATAAALPSMSRDASSGDASRPGSAGAERMPNASLSAVTRRSTGIPATRAACSTVTSRAMTRRIAPLRSRAKGGASRAMTSTSDSSRASTSLIRSPGTTGLLSELFIFASRRRCARAAQRTGGCRQGRTRPRHGPEAGAPSPHRPRAHRGRAP
jgi:hypothetical protein